MVVNSAYRRNSRIAYKDKTQPLAVGSCGSYRLLTRAVLPTHWQRGRPDYQLLYVAAGKAEFYFGGEKRVIMAGSMVLYRPQEEQKYRYYGVDRPEVYWVHFTGGDVKNILRQYGIEDAVQVIRTGIMPEYKRIFTQMIEELQLCREGYDELLVLLLRQIFILLRRSLASRPKGRLRYMERELLAAVKYCQSHYNEDISTEGLAASLGMSVSWLIRSFREYTGTTPTQYVRTIRIANAQNLLETTDLTASEISGMLGYSDPLYFSRVFKRESGISPTEFRRRSRDGSSI